MMSKPEKQSRPTSASQRAADQISQLIFTGELIADSNHLESELASRLGISRTPIREATLMLQARGLLEVQPRKGVRICAMSAEDIEEVLVVLTELECLAVRLAAQANHNKSDLVVLEENIQAIDIALKNNDSPARSAAEEQFSIQLVLLSNNGHILSIVKTLHDRIRRARNVVVNLETAQVGSDNPYRQIYDAILSGDANTADQVHRTHSAESRSTLIDTLQQLGIKRI